LWPGMLRFASTSAAPFVATTIDFSRLPDGPTTPSVQLSAWPSSPRYRSMAALLCGRWSRHALPGAVRPSSSRYPGPRHYEHLHSLAESTATQHSLGREQQAQPNAISLMPWAFLHCWGRLGRGVPGGATAGG